MLVTDERPQTRGEEIANSVSHGVALLAAVVGSLVLVRAAFERGTVVAVVGASVFAATMILLYLTSTIYHAIPAHRATRAKRAFQVADHVAIFLLIAGTYTPITLGVLAGAWGWTLFGLVWGCALAGITIKVFRGTAWPALSLGLYLACGWMAVIAARPLWLAMDGWGIFWLVAGGLAYTAGVAFFLAERVRYGHFVWHLFVMGGTGCHFIAVFAYAQ